ncbi:MAG TPA: hypothetical protein VGC85_04365, partial [Chthoniobacterales bacterium]
AAGGYLLARGRQLAIPLAIFVGLVSALNGWIICWGASDWFGALAAFTWLPWSWWALERCAAPNHTPARVLLPAPFIYLLVTGGFPYTILMLALITGWIVLRALATRRDWSVIVRLASSWVLGFGLSAPAWISLITYSIGARRAGEVFRPKQWLVPFTGLPSLVLPEWTVQWRVFEEVLVSHSGIELACGLVPVAILVAVVVSWRTMVLKLIAWELGLLAAVLALCMLPSISIFRFSFRWLALFHLVLALTAAEAWHAWNQLRAERRGYDFANAALWAVILVAISWGSMHAFNRVPKEPSVAVPLVTLAIATTWCIVDAVVSRRAASWLLPAVTFLALLTTYLTVDAHALIARYWFGDNLRGSAPLDANRLYLSIYPAPQAYYRSDMTGMAYGATTRPGSTSMFDHVHLINGYSPVGPAGVARLFDFGTHGHINPAKVSEVVIPEAGAGGLLEQLGIDGIIVAHESWLPSPLPPNWKLAFSDGEADVYYRDIELPKGAASPDGATIRVIEESRLSVVVDAAPTDNTSSSRIVFRRPYFPGYHAKLNGRALPVSSFEGLTPMITLPAGQSGRVELTYRPLAVTLGGAIALATLLLVLALAGREYKAARAPR